MGPKRKRGRLSRDDNSVSCKRPRPERPKCMQNFHPTLRLYYRHIITLRDYLLSQLPKTSKKRRRIITTFGKISEDKRPVSLTEPYAHNNGEESLATLLDQTLVCSVDESPEDECGYDAKDVEAFSQRASLTAGSSCGGWIRTQSELVDIAIHLLFYRLHPQIYRPPHLLCHGYQRAGGPLYEGGDMCAMAGIMGITSNYPNNNVSILKSALWCDLFEMLGKEGEHLMLKMLVHCGIFTRIGSEKGNFSQLCGKPLSDVDPLAPPKEPSKIAQSRMVEDGREPELGADLPGGPRNPAGVCFVRSRMLYARAAVNAKGKVVFGLRHIHALNRFPNSRNENHTNQLMRYIFPREFGLHNVFTSKVDKKETAQPFKDYTMRDAEIAHRDQNLRRGQSTTKSASRRIPKRLRGGIRNFVRKIQIRHSKCRYNELMKHYCSLMSSAEPCDPMNSKISHEYTANSTVHSVPGLPHTSSAIASRVQALSASKSFTDLATPHAKVSAFCRAVLSNLLPKEFWGQAESGLETKANFMRNVDRFIKLRKFDPMSLHEVSQGIKSSDMAWLVPPGLDPQARLAQSDTRRRKEILLEFLYYIFDSFLIPLIRSNFHVTESSTHQNHVFYFRHDVWRLLTEPFMASIKASLFQEIKAPNAKRLLDARPLGFSQIRLLPKSAGMRPITNLRRRMTKLQNGKMGLGRSINQVLKPVHDIFEFERRRRPWIAGSSLFSVGEMYPILKRYSSSLGENHGPLYFAKADAKSCFDTIPQQELMDLMKSLVSESEYRIARHSEIKALKSSYSQASRKGLQGLTRKFKTTANVASNFDSFDEVIKTSFTGGKRNTIFVDGIVQQPHKTEKVLDLLEHHVRGNIIKIGKKFFRQTSGIPQGSIVSSLLCNFFYAQLEAENFTFLDAEESVFLRLIDDFLLITTNKDHAIRFLQIMHDGIKKFGVSVNPAKTLANFQVVINGCHVPQLTTRGSFPYCGSMIDTMTLEITKDRNRRKETVLSNTLTVDLSKMPGQNFYRKTLSAFKIQIHEMFLDTGFNSPTTVLSTIYQNFTETAMKCYRYSKSMGGSHQPSADLLIGTIRDLIDLAYVLVKGKHKNHHGKAGDYERAVSKGQIRWLAGRAFRHVLDQKQTKFHEVVEWLERMMADAGVGGQHQWNKLEWIAQDGDAVFQGYKY